MSIVTTAITRLSKREKKLKRRLNRLTLIAVYAGLIFAVGMVAIYVADPRVRRNTVVMGVDIGGLDPAEAVKTLELSFEKAMPVSLAFPGGRLHRTLAECGLRPDFKSIVQSASSRLWWLGVPVRWQSRGDFDALRFASLVREIEARLPRPKNARFVVEGDRVRIEPSVTGLAVDVEPFKQRILDVMKKPVDSIDVPLKEEKPALTTEGARAMGINRLLGSYTTRYVEDRTRSENIKLATARISGTILAPGETFSFNATVGPRSEEDGYKEANIFVGNKIEKGYGGGVCQVSTTLYNAVLLANLEIVERHPHSMIVDYVPLGRDAAVSYGDVDLVFRNNTQGHVMIIGETRPGLVTFKVFGDGPEVKVSIESKVLSKIDFEIEVIKDPTLPVGKREVTPGKTGYRVVTYKIVTDAEKRTTRSILNYSSYKPMKQVVKEGAMP